MCLQKHYRCLKYLQRSRDHECSFRDSEMKITRSASGLLGLAMLLCTADTGLPQWPPELRRARPMDWPPVARALPLEEPPTPVPLRSAEEPSEPAAQDTE